MSEQAQDKSKYGTMSRCSSAHEGWEIDGTMKSIAAHMAETATLPLNQIFPW
jgi:hypothetical protein